MRVCVCVCVCVYIHKDRERKVPVDLSEIGYRLHTGSHSEWTVFTITTHWKPQWMNSIYDYNWSVGRDPPEHVKKVAYAAISSLGMGLSHVQHSAQLLHRQTVTVRSPLTNTCNSWCNGAQKDNFVELDSSADVNSLSQFCWRHRKPGPSQVNSQVIQLIKTFLLFWTNEKSFTA